MFDRYVGLPFADKGRAASGVDCWGLVFLINRAERGIELPSYSDRYVTSADAKDIASLINGEMSPWREIEAGQEAPFDCVLIREGSFDRHIGLVVTPGRMLHVRRGHSSAIESYRTGVWRHRVVGFFRYMAKQ